MGLFHDIKMVFIVIFILFKSIIKLNVIKVVYIFIFLCAKYDTSVTAMLVFPMFIKYFINLLLVNFIFIIEFTVKFTIVKP